MMRMVSVLLMIVLLGSMASPPRLVTAGDGSQDERGQYYEKLLRRELDLLGEMDVDLSEPLVKWELARNRLKLAAYHYQNFRRNRHSVREMLRALEYATSATEYAPSMDEAWLMLGMLCSEFTADKTMLARATDALIKAVDINPANGKAQLLLARVLMEQGRFWSAIEQYKNLFARDDSMINGINLSALTLAYIADGRVKAGLNYMFQLSMDPQHAQDVDINICLAVLLKHDGRLSMARTYLQLLLTKDYPSRAQKEYITALLQRWEKIDEE